MNRAKLLAVAGFFATLLGAQVGTKPLPTSPTTAPASGTIGTGATSLPGIGSNPPAQPNPVDSHPIFISGRVMMADGLPVPINVGIQRACYGTPRTMAYTDVSGGFSFRWGQADMVVAEASEGGSGSRSLPGMSGTSGSGGSGMGNTSNPRSTLGCELRANLAGYRSDVITLSDRTSLENGDIGVIVLHRQTGEVKGGSVSASSLKAPKRAKKAYELGLLALAKNNPDRAVRDFENAVAEYPGYADAWLSLGKLRRDQSRNEQARMAFEKAATADPKLVTPFIELGIMASEDRKWEDTLSYLDHATRLDPANYPVAWYTMALAGYNLKKYDAAEANVRRAVRLDPKHGIPREHYLLGLILEQKKDLAGAAAEFALFLKYDPIAPDEPQLRAEIRRIEKTIGEASQAAK